MVTKTPGEGLWSRLYAAVRDGEQRQPITEAFYLAQRGTTRATIFRLCGARSDPTAMYHSEAAVITASIRNSASGAVAAR